MLKFKQISILAFLFLVMSAVQAFAQVPQDIITSLDEGDSKLLAGYFNQNVELVVLDNDNVYSKAQAEQIVNNFFSNFNPVSPNAFSVIHNSGKEGAKSIIGKLKTTKGDFRVYFLLKKNGNKEYIHRLSIEKQ